MLHRFLTIGLLALSATTVSAQLLGMGTGRAHPELHWQEMETQHFLIVYPRSLLATATKVASVAEQVYEPLLRGMHLTGTSRKIAITITSEDEIVNGFAMPGKMFLWVNQNDAPQFFSGTEKWLRKVIAHEMQHDLWMEAGQDWMGIWSLLRTPAWFIEGLAEYHTEEWGAYRSDLRVRDHILRNQEEQLDPHDSGFTRVRYLAETYGDSVITGAVRERNRLGLATFGKGFQERAGITVDEFEEEWRRVASAYTYAIWSQKERVTDVGKALRVPMQKMSALEFAPDGKRVAVLAQSVREELPVLAVVNNDSTRRTVELDHGLIDRDFAFSPDGRHLVYAKMHRSTHGGLLWDLKIADTESGSSQWITSGKRASHPHWSPQGDRIVFTRSVGETTDLYTMDPFGDDMRSLTRHGYDVQCFSPRFSPDGTHVVFGKFEPNRHLDLALLDLATGEARYLTDDARRDLRPRFGGDGNWVYFTADRNADHVPNLHRVPVSGGEADVVAMSDVGEALFGLDVDPRDGTIAAAGLATTDTMRLRAVEPDRQVEVVTPAIDPRLTSWRERKPPIPIGEVDPLRPVNHTPSRTYRSWRHMRPFMKWVLPSFVPWGVQGGAIWLDASHKTAFGLGLDAGTSTEDDSDEFELRGAYANLSTIRPPLWLPGQLDLWGTYEARTGVRLYDDVPLYDVQSGGGFGWQQPFNFGEHLYANHRLELFGQYTDVRTLDYDDLDLTSIAAAGLPQPRKEYVESIVGAAWRFTHRRPRQAVHGHEQGGGGMLARFDWSDWGFGSDFEYRRIDVDLSHAPRLPWLGYGLFVRGRYQGTWGEPAPQDFTGLRADPRILPVSYDASSLLGDFLEIGDSYALRGYPVNVPGTRAMLSTVEWRLPLFGPLPVAAFGLSLGGLTGVLFHDHGRVYDDSGEIEARHTAGWELRLAIRLGSATLAVPSYGEGQSLKWENENEPVRKDHYFRLAFTQGF